jgi:hypothetical protein
VGDWSYRGLARSSAGPQWMPDRRQAIGSFVPRAAPAHAIGSRRSAIGERWRGGPLINRYEIGFLLLHSDASGGFWAAAKQVGSDGGRMQRPGLKSNAERRARQNLRGSRQAHSAISRQRKSATKNERLYRGRKLAQSHNNWSEGALAQYLRS